jgi:hypothetical protein
MNALGDHRREILVLTQRAHRVPYYRAIKYARGHRLNPSESAAAVLPWSPAQSTTQGLNAHLSQHAGSLLTLDAHLEAEDTHQHSKPLTQYGNTLRHQSDPQYLARRISLWRD